ncbi:DEAD/DEAH box helicase [Planomonospora parontospora]|uniref:DEAD/DEAH box helicase n=1 Tax=Planomonospora parontospora TaxID=58119 RepID=UPI0019C0A215|nr:DEAD/DEAH box helicase [Planomonospora parontospora]GGL33162.1 helicase SNF2 [Planomonospora parontospora subsp. antibiotica]
MSVTEPEGGRLPAKEADVLCRDAHRLLGDARALLGEYARARKEAEGALGALRAGLARAELGSIPVARLKDVTGGRLRLGALEGSGYATVLDVLESSPYYLQLIPGIGTRTVKQVHAAARQIAQAVEEAVRVRIDVERHDPLTTGLLVALHRLVTAGPELAGAREVAHALDERIGPLLADARPARGRLRMMLTRPERRRRAREALAEISELLGRSRETRLLLTQVTTDLLRPAASEFEVWTDFEFRAPDYYGLLAELAGGFGAAGHGLLSDELVAKIDAQELDGTHRRVSLRGYQAFGARFALAQRRVVLGDEMGLGKSIEAIAALAHLKAEGRTHFLVVCPTSVLINWLRELRSRSTLSVHPLHGTDRSAAEEEWVRQGGVAVVTLDSLYRMKAPGAVEVGMLVVDEAHYVKNPQSRRSRAVAQWCRHAERVLFLTGTPMENRVEEFRVLLSYLQPELAASLRGSGAAAGARAFRKAIAPAYLRRNQQDVLTELPDVVRAEEWVEFSGADLAAYRQAVEAGNFMDMRRAAYASPATSAKLKRLLELVEDARVNGLKVVVFSYFRDVLASVGAALDGRAHGPISGDLAPARRQQLVDEFSDIEGHAVLLGQIQAGGVGLNLQAASVVIMCEPQVKPTTEAQAVARAHRMGQVRKVQVHRLLAVDSVDQRMLDILGSKERLFDAYARRSDLAESSADAVDVSEQALARRIVEEEQRRLAVRRG